jgi:hypothetical protein
LISYFLIKFVPLWGLTLIATLVTYLGPLIYIQNKEVIDAQLEKGRQIASEQATQIKGLANQHAENAAKTVQGYTQQYTAKAQETINQYRGRSTSPEARSRRRTSPPLLAMISLRRSTRLPSRTLPSLPCKRLYELRHIEQHSLCRLVEALGLQDLGGMRHFPHLLRTLHDDDDPQAQS